MVKYEAITITTLLMRKVALDRLINLPISGRAWIQIVVFLTVEYSAGESQGLVY